jgi:predicted amidohydrolase
MSRLLPIAAVQAVPTEPDTALADFAADVTQVVRGFPATRLVIYPELHLTNGREDVVSDLAEPLDGPRGKTLATLAGDLGVWLAPGSVYELGDDGHVYNTALLYSPAGELVASYRKVLPWRPFEVSRPGDQFVVADIPDIGRVGFSICYDTWYPESTRALAWQGAEVVLNVVKTTTSDRSQELVLARANAIVNQVYFVSVNAAGPRGTGRSLIVDPEGLVRVEAAGAAPAVLTDVLDLDACARVRRYGTAALNRVWSQFQVDDPVIDLPMYEGQIDPAKWAANAGD